MKVTAKDVERVAKLSRIKIESGEQGGLIEALERISRFADMLSEADTDNVQPTCHGVILQNVLREDVVTNSYDRNLLLKNAPESHDGCFAVPKVVE